MSLTNKFGLVAGTTALAIAGTAFGGVESDNDALAQIAELKQELAELKQQNGQDWLTEQRSSEIRGIVQDVLADADTRTSLQSSGAMAGYNNGFFLASPDGNFSLKVGGQIQIRWVMNSAKDQNTAWGFENRRTKLDFQGNVFSKDWTYRVRSNFSNDFAGVNALEFAYVEKAMDNGMSIRVGQFQAPWLREVLVDASMQLAAERSVMAQLFSQGYSQGIQWGMESDSFRINAGLFDGIGGTSDLAFDGYNSRNTNWEFTPTNYAVAARADFKLSGDWSQFDDFSSFKGEEAGMMAGVAVLYQRANGNPNTFGPPAGNKVFGITGDFTWDFGGASIFASGVWTQNKPESGDKTSPWGFTFQGGYFLSEDLELFGRYEYVNYNVSQPGGNDVNKYNGVTFGANYFFAKGVKFTADFSWNLKSLDAGTFPSAVALNGSGFRGDVNGNKNQWALRAQLQLLF